MKKKNNDIKPRPEIPDSYISPLNGVGVSLFQVMTHVEPRKLKGGIYPIVLTQASKRGPISSLKFLVWNRLQS